MASLQAADQGELWRRNIFTGLSVATGDGVDTFRYQGLGGLFNPASGLAQPRQTIPLDQNQIDITNLENYYNQMQSRSWTVAPAMSTAWIDQQNWQQNTAILAGNQELAFSLIYSYSQYSETWLVSNGEKTSYNRDIILLNAAWSHPLFDLGIALRGGQSKLLTSEQSHGSMDLGLTVEPLPLLRLSVVLQEVVEYRSNKDQSLFQPDIRVQASFQFIPANLRFIAFLKWSTIVDSKSEKATDGGVALEWKFWESWSLLGAVTDTGYHAGVMLRQSLYELAFAVAVIDKIFMPTVSASAFF